MEESRRRLGLPPPCGKWEATGAVACWGGGGGWPPSLPPRAARRPQWRGCGRQRTGLGRSTRRPSRPSVSETRTRRRWRRRGSTAVCFHAIVAVLPPRRHAGHRGSGSGGSGGPATAHPASSE